MPDVEGFQKGISNITHLKTNPPKLHSLAQRTFYPRLRGTQPDSRGRVSLLPPAGHQLQSGRKAGPGWGPWAEPEAGEWSLRGADGPPVAGRTELGPSHSVFSPARGGWPSLQMRNHRSQGVERDAQGGAWFIRHWHSMPMPLPGPYELCWDSLLRENQVSSVTQAGPGQRGGRPALEAHRARRGPCTLVFSPWEWPRIRDVTPTVRPREAPGFPHTKQGCGGFAEPGAPRPPSGLRDLLTALHVFPCLAALGCGTLARGRLQIGR